MSAFVGTGVALVTPFKDDLSIDFEALKHRKNTKIDLDFGLVCFWALHGCPLQPPTPSRALPVLPGPSPASKKRNKF